MKAIFYALLGLHSLIHLFGFLKAFGLSEFEALTQSISRPLGLLWLVAGILLLISGFLLYREYQYWWVVGLLAVVVSQVLILFFWKDAKFGTLPNFIILLVCIIGWVSYNFNAMVRIERTKMITKGLAFPEMDKSAQWNNLPAPVKKWLQRSELEQRPMQQIYLGQKVRMKLKPEQEKWLEADAEQYFTLHPPAFNWSIDLPMNALMSIQGRDRFEEGKGSMLMKMWSLFAVANVEDQPKVNEAALQRYLAEIVWFPSAALGPYINWEAINERSARANLSYMGTQGSGIFHFDAEGDFMKFTSLRYKETDDNAIRYEWIVEAMENKTVKGIRIPVKCRVSWQLETGRWTWLEIEIEDYQYN